MSKKISELNNLASTAVGDLLPIVDISDSTQNISGSTKKITMQVVIDFCASYIASLTQTLTNKTLTLPVISSIVNTGTLTLPTSTDTLVGRATTDTLTNKTLTSPVINTGISGTAIDTDGTLAANSDTKLASQKAVKTYVDTGIAGISTSSITNVARAYQSTQQTNLTSGSWVKISLQTETYDTGNNFDSTTNYRYTAPSTGYYQVNAVLGFGVTVANKYLAVGIRLNGSTFLAYSWVQTDNSGQVSAHLSDIIYMTAGQYIEMMGQVVGDSTFDVLADPIATYMSVAYLGTGS